MRTVTRYVRQSSCSSKYTGVADRVTKRDLQWEGCWLIYERLSTNEDMGFLALLKAEDL